MEKEWDLVLKISLGEADPTGAEDVFTGVFKNLRRHYNPMGISPGILQEPKTALQDPGVVKTPSRIRFNPVSI